MTNRRRDGVDRRRESDPHAEIERRSMAVHDLDVRVERPSANRVILHMTHEFVAQNHYLLDEILERLSPCQPGLRVEIEMSGVPYADSQALGRLIAWSKRLGHAGAHFIIANPTPYLLSILQLLKLDTALAIVHRHAQPLN